VDLDEVAQAEDGEGGDEGELAGADVEDVPGEDLADRVGVDGVGQEGEVAVARGRAGTAAEGRQ